MPKGSEEVYTDPSYKYLGHFNQKKVLMAGHNETDKPKPSPAECAECLNTCQILPPMQRKKCRDDLCAGC